jgi:hypothetical protein
MSQMVGQTNGWVWEYLEQWPENHLEHQMEKCLERIRLEGQKRPEKQPEKRLGPLNSRAHNCTDLGDPIIHQMNNVFSCHII